MNHIPVITFFNNKGGVGKTSLVYHLTWMLADLGKRVLAIDLDPQANLTSAFLPEERLEALWDPESAPQRADTVFQCIRPLTQVGDIKEAAAIRISDSIRLVAGDLGLAGFEDQLSTNWPEAMGGSNLFRPFRVLTAFWQIAQLAARSHSADVILADVGPNLGAINRSALIGTDHVVIPLAADLFSLQGLTNLGPTLREWRSGWTKRLDNWVQPEFSLPMGTMKPLGYVVQQHSERISRPVKAYDKWFKRIPSVYRESVLDTPSTSIPQPDPECLARLKHYRSLIPMAQEARKPVFKLTSADGAIGNHTYAVTEARGHFRDLAAQILSRMQTATLQSARVAEP